MAWKLPERLQKNRWGKSLWFALCTAILPVCFWFSIFDEVLYNKLVVMAGFAFFCIWLFLRNEHRKIFHLSLIDRFVIAMSLAVFLTTLRALDRMADYQTVAYTHIEELERLFAAAAIACFVYQYHRKAFQAGMQIISWIIWGTAIHELIVYLPKLSEAGYLTPSAIEEGLRFFHYENINFSVYRHPIPCATAFVIGLALPLVRRWRWLDLLLKLVYIPAIIIPYARSGWIGAAAVLLLVAFELIHKRYPKLGKWWIVILAVPAAAALFLYLWIFHFDSRGSSIGGMQNGRLQYWRYALTVLFPNTTITSKLFGNGFYTSIVMDQTPVAMPGFPAIDNGFITLFYEQGILGFAAVICLFIRACQSVWKIDQDRWYAIALIGAAVTGLFYEIQFWAQIGFLMAVLLSVFFGKTNE